MANKPTLIKSKLFKLKEWLTVPDAARHLSIIFSEEVSKADVLQLALDRHLKLSVNFVNHTYAKRGTKLLTFEEWESKFRSNFSIAGLRKNAIEGPNGEHWYRVPGTPDGVICPEDKREIKKENRKGKSKKDVWEGLTTKQLNEIIDMIISLHKKRSKEFGGKVPPDLFDFSDKVTKIEGVWDLSMIGNERLDIEHEYQMLTGGPDVTLTCLEGAFVEGKDNLIYQLQETFDKEYFKRHQDEEWKKKRLDFYANILKKKLSKKEIDEKEAAKLLEQRKQNLSKPINYNDNFYPAGSLPDDSVLVVRTQALMDLQESLSSEESTEGTLPGAPYLDTRHAFCAKELRIAVDVWTELYEKNPPRHVPQGGHKKYIIKWLEEKYPDLGQRAQERIATIINPNPRGGASPINKNS